MKKSLFLLAFTTFFYSTYSQLKVEKIILQKVEQLKLAMINADSALLDELTSTELSYGHSGGTVEGKDAFIKKLTSGKSDFVSMDFSENSILVSGDVAIVRYKMNAITNDNSLSGEVHLSILLVWKKHRHQWKLLARQAVKKP